MDFNNLDFVRWGTPASARSEEGGLPPLPTGIKVFDERVGGGMHPGCLYRMSGRAAAGKSTCALAIAQCVALGVDHDGQPMRDGHARPHPVLFFSLDIPRNPVVQGLTGSFSDTTGHENRAGVADLRELVGTPKLDPSKLDRAPIFVDATEPLHICDLTVRARDMKSRHGIELVIIDYLHRLQLCSCSECACLGRRAETSASLHGLVKLAEELHLPVLVLEQANAGQARGQGILV